MVNITEEVSKTIENYIKDVNQQIGIKKAVLYGSYAKGSYDDFSDLDIAIFSDYFKDKSFIEATKFLLSLARKYKNVCMEPVGFSSSDLLDDNPFVKEILATGQEIRF
jgi:predicted nucleotidyltransferase